MGRAVERLRTWLAVGLVAALAFGAGQARAQETDEPSPRTTLEAFLDAARRGHYSDASQQLAHDGQGPAFANPALTARQLKAVLDTYVFTNIDKVSDAPEGRLDDHLPPTLEEIGRVPGPNGPESLRMVRLANGRWVFSSNTVARVPVWYAGLPDRWIRDVLPEPLLRPGPRDLFWWQWLALPLFLLLCYVLGRLVAAAARFVLHRLARRTPNTFDDTLIERTKGPLRLLTASLVAHVLVGTLLLTPPAEDFVLSIVLAMRLAAIFWGALRTVDLALEAVRGSNFARERPETLGVLPLLNKAAKIGLAVLAVVVVLQKLGYPAESLIAGLGIGGLAFALAAQKTVENLFGSVTLGVDQPFRPGDLVNVDGTVGVVESVGLRSTRVRTLARTIVTWPNGKLAEMKIETYAPRDRLRLAMTLNLVYSTRSEQMRRILDDVRAALQAHPKLFEPPVVFFSNLGPHSLDVEVGAWFSTTDAGEFNAIKQEMLLKFMEIVERNGSDFAFPTSTVQVVGDSGGQLKPAARA